MEFLSYINTYGFVALGCLLVLFNLPVLVVVSASKNLRNQYGVLIISLFNGFLSGLVSTAYGIFRLVLYMTGKDNDFITIRECFYNPLTFFNLWTLPMCGLGLLLLSVDRLLVISFPLTYFNYNTKVVLVSNVLALVINACIVFVASYVTINNGSSETLISTICNQKEVFSMEIYIILIGSMTLFAVLADLLMFVVLILFMKQHRAGNKKAFLTDDAIKRFERRQMNYTKTMLISSIATIVVFIIPSIFAIVARTLDMPRQIATWTRFINFFNSFNIAILLIYRQRDIRRQICKMANCLTGRSFFNVVLVDNVRDHTKSDTSRQRTTEARRR
ncbi:hypothetical protein QR680_016475 [Steinernema hermaphroditum]|uniref:G-protein coupled receptors family 1 profile domain-containing protein n=1 Tax=Steinernema hermaphroditum TaxID=289476 RepID=A0AA39HDT1_9BILA|nr:hypothetical protein QR680_016475 [Steinernema hermaphroditum]